MDSDYLWPLVVLDRERDWERAAAACQLSPADLRKRVQAAEAEYQVAIVQPGAAFQGFTEQGDSVVAWAKDFFAACDDLKQGFRHAKKQERLAPLLQRASVSPKRLCGPGPEDDDMQLLIQAALRAPDHGSLHPWRLLEFRAEQRAALADLFEQEKLRRDPLAAANDLRIAREHATRPPVLMAFVVSPKAKTKVPLREQWLSAGAALGNFLNAAHQLGFGAIMLSGERCFDASLSAALGLQPHEFLAGFISLGSVAEAPPARKQVAPNEVRSHWTPAGIPSAHPLSDPSGR